jgi:hypothetical protein
MSRPALGLTQPPIPHVQVFFLFTVKRPRREAEQLRSCSPEVKNELSCNSAPLLSLYRNVKENFTFLPVRKSTHILYNFCLCRFNYVAISTY